LKIKIENSARGVTIVEILVVISIITILAGLTLTALSYIRKSSNEKATQATLLLLTSALERYENDFHDYPSSDGDMDGITGAENMWKCLNTEKIEGPYLKSGDIKSVDSNSNGDPEPADAWNHPIRYTHHRDYRNRQPNKASFRLISDGNNTENEAGRPGSDDIVNWNREKPDQN
jgi:prepilin-type N-terminal cleavage/methylation domain-containing protein